jgi:hypothetical protein
MFCSESVGVENELKKAAQAAEKRVVAKNSALQAFCR